MRFRDFIQEAPMNGKAFAGVDKRLGGIAKVGFEFELLVPVGTRLYDEGTDNRGTQVISYYDTLDEFEEFFDMSRAQLREIDRDFESWKESKQDDENTKAEEDEREPEDLDFEFRDWLHEEFRTRYDFTQQYSLEPKYGWYDESGRHASIYTEEKDESGNADQTAEMLSDSLETIVDGTVKVVNTYHGEVKNGTSWYIEPDGSIDGHGHGLEIVSPPFELGEAITNLRNVVKWMDRYDLQTNKSTGLHINISIPDLAQKLDPVKLVLFMGEMQPLKVFGRVGNTYTEPVRDAIIGRIKKDGVIPQSAHAMIETAKKFMTTSKYFTVNFAHKDYLEFRAAGGENYHTKLKEIEDAVHRFAYAVELACDPLAERQEYLKKVVALFAQVKNDIQDKPERHVVARLDEIPKELRRLYKFNHHILDCWKMVEGDDTAAERRHGIAVLIDQANRALKNFKTHLEFSEKLFFKKLAKENALQSSDIDEHFNNDHLTRLEVKKEFGL